MATRITVRRDTAANWAASGIVPLFGEPVAVVDSTGAVSYKIGDGKLTVPNLPALSKGDRGEQGLPGTNGVATDDATATNISTAGTKTQAAADSRYLPTNGKRPVGKSELVHNVLDYGAKGDGAADDTSGIQAAIAAASGSAFGIPGVVFLPRGQYIVTTLQMAKGITMRGSGKDITTIYARSGDSSPALITFPQGYIDNVHFEDLTFYGGGSNNPGQHGIYAYARADNGSSGWGTGGMRRVATRNFQGAGMWLRGGGGTGREGAQHQYLVFEHCDFIADRTVSTSTATLMTGKNGQITFINCQLNTSAGTSESAGTNLVIGTERADDGSSLSTAGTYAATFVNCSIEGRARGVTLDGAQSVTFTGTFMEALGNAIRAANDSRGVVFIGTHWANAGHNNAGTGSLVEGAGTSVVNVYGGAVLGQADKSWVDAVVARGVNIAPSVASSANTGQVGVSGSSVDIRHYTTVLVNSPATVASITSAHPVGTTIYLKAFTGTLTLTNTGNIDLNGASSLTVTTGHIATLVRLDLTATWQVTSVS